jgi:citrate lyase subunit beta/citryl-CoA lyase
MQRDLFLPMHPSQALFQGQPVPQWLPACDHYAGAEKYMLKALKLQQALGPVFDITLDCEDGATVGNEAGHAQLIGDLIVSDGNRFDRVGVRVHAIDHSCFAQDVETICSIAGQRLAYFMLPKISGVTELKRAIELINHHVDSNSSSQNKRTTALPIHVLIETHGALRDVFEIAAIPQVQSLSFGIMDFVSAHFGAIPASAMHSPQQFTHPLVQRAKLQVAAAAHSYSKTPSHNVTINIDDTAIVADDAKRAATEFGYTRMWSIHPTQIKTIVDAFKPAMEDVDQSLEILGRAQASNWGPIQYKGKLHDRGSYRHYWTVLQCAKAHGLSLPQEAASML